jgi:hypothetical protein
VPFSTAGNWFAVTHRSNRLCSCHTNLFNAYRLNLRSSLNEPCVKPEIL